MAAACRLGHNRNTQVCSCAAESTSPSNSSRSLLSASAAARLSSVNSPVRVPIKAAVERVPENRKDTSSPSQASS